MIQKAHIGVGIFGKEGYQAASSADYAFGQFRFLRRLIFVHGRWSGIRISNFTIMFFFKNLVFSMLQFWFGFYNGFSGQTFWEDMYITTFNSVMTAFSAASYAICEKDIEPDDPKLSKLIDCFFPQLYQRTQENELLSTKKFIQWFIVSIILSIVVFAVPMIAIQQGI